MNCEKCQDKGFTEENHGLVMVLCDCEAGKRKRAPKLMRGFGLEWLYRLVREPRRIGRIFKAVVVFPYLVLFSKKR